jgi:hypothetical protein
MGISLDNVFLGQVNSYGELYVDLFDDATKVSKNTVRENLYANIQQCQADLLKFSLETQREEAKNMYQQNSKQLGDLLEKLKPYLL